MASSYFLDKRVVKKFFLKIFIEFLIIFPLLVLFNYLVGDGIKEWVSIFLDVVLGLVLFIAIGFIYDKIENHLKEKKEQRIRDYKESQKAEGKNNGEREEQIVKPAKVKSVKKKRKRRVRKG